MEKALFIVESPAKAKTINRYLGPGYKVMASMGHVRDLPKSKLGVDIEHGFEPQYVPCAVEPTKFLRRNSGTWSHGMAYEVEPSNP